MDDPAEPSPIQFGLITKARREDLGLSQDEVSEAGGPSGPTLRKIESGSGQRPNHSTLRKLDESLRWVPGSAARTWSGGKPTPVEDTRRPPSAAKTLALGPREMVMTDRDLTDLLKLQRALNDGIAEQEALNGKLIPTLAAARDDLNRFASRVSGAYVTVLLERNGGPGVALHPIVEFAVGHLLDSPPDADDPHEREQRLYRRWLAGRLHDVDDETDASFRKRWEESQREDPTVSP